MLRYVLRRLALSIPVLIVVPFLVFALLDLSPGDAAAEVAGPGASPEQIAQVRQQLHLNDPLLVRYANWAGDVVFHGSFGTSFASQQPVTTMIGRALPITLSLGLLAIAFVTVFGVAIGTFAAYHKDGLVDRAVSFFTSIAIAIPSFWLGLMLVLIFSINLKWLPALGYVGLADDPVEWFRHLLLPALALAAVPCAALALQTRAALINELEQDYVLAARSRGIPRPVVLFKHALKNGGVPVTTTLGFLLANLLAGAVIIEQVFNLHGLGQLAVTAASGKDIPLLLGVVVMITVSIVIVNLLVDLSYGYFSPRARRNSMTRDVSPSMETRSSEPLSQEVPSSVVSPTATRRRHAGTERFRAFLKKPVAVAAACFLALEIAVTLFAPLIAPYNPDEQDLVNRLQGSSAQHWLGTDAFGRDALSRLIYGGRVSLTGAAIAVVVACVGGISLGLLAGYAGRSTDLVLSRIIDVIMSVPGLILAITIVAVLGPGLVTAMIAIGIASIPGFYRITRGQAQVITSEVFVEASRMIGCTRRRIIWHHVLPNMWSPIIVLIALALGVAVTAEAALSFIGLGVQPPTASWGSMLQGATTSLNIAPILVIAPGVAIALTVLAFQLIGNGLRDAFGSGRESVMTA